MDIHRLRCVVSLARLHNVTRAAEENYVAQSTMSSTISAIEAELGCKLFIRKNRSVETTEAGELFASVASEMLALYDKACDDLERLKHSSPKLLTIGFNTVTLGSCAPEILLSFQKAHPDIEIRLRKHSLTKLMELLATGQADIVFTNQFEVRRHQATRYVVIAETRPCVYLPRRHRLASKQSLTPEDLIGERLLCACSEGDPGKRSAAGDVLAEGGIAYDERSPIPNESTIFSMVESGLGIYPASTWYARSFEDRVVCVPLELDVENMQIVIAWHSEEFDSLASDLAMRTRQLTKDGAANPHQDCAHGNL